MQRNPIAVIPLRDLSSGSGRDYLIKWLLNTAATSLWFGDTNTGKTFLALDAAMKVALGERFFDKRVRQGAVVYVIGEGIGGIRDRLTAYCLHHDVKPEDADFALIIAPVRLCGDTHEIDTPALIEALLAHAQTVPDGRLSLVVIDTVSRAMSGADENSSEAMTGFVKQVDAIRDATQAHVMLVHHTPKTSTGRARGHSSLEAAVDTGIELIASEDGLRTATVRKQRDYQAGEVFTFRLETVELGIDADGDPITSCVVVPSDEAPRKKAPKLADSEQVYLRLLREAGPDGLLTEEWATAARMEGIGTGPQRYKHTRIRGKLKDLGLVRTYADRWHVAG